MLSYDCFSINLLTLAIQYQPQKELMSLESTGEKQCEINVLM